MQMTMLLDRGNTVLEINISVVASGVVTPDNVDEVIQALADAAKREAHRRMSGPVTR
jgi:hypothetical protein